MGDVAALTWPLTRPAGGGLPALPSSNRARRCLFGPVDHERARADLEENMRKILNQDKLRWNFDFETGRPLPSGRYQWERVDPSPDGGGDGSKDADQKHAKQGEQTRVTDFMRKRKSSNLKDGATQRPKTRRRSST